MDWSELRAELHKPTTFGEFVAGQFCGVFLAAILGCIFSWIFSGSWLCGPLTGAACWLSTVWALFGAHNLAVWILRRRLRSQMDALIRQARAEDRNPFGVIDTTKEYIEQLERERDGRKAGL